MGIKPTARVAVTPSAEPRKTVAVTPNAEPRKTVALIDGASLHTMAEAMGPNTKINFEVLYEVLKKAARELGGDPSQMRAVFYAAVALDERCQIASEGQRRLEQKCTEIGYEFVGLDYRKVSLSTPPNAPSAFVETTSIFAPICFSLGTLYAKANPTVLVVGHSFEYADPLTQLQKSGASTGIVCFRQFLNNRWDPGEDLIGGTKVRFFNLDKNKGELLGIPRFEPTSSCGTGRMAVAF